MEQLESRGTPKAGNEVNIGVKGWTGHVLLGEWGGKELVLSVSDGVQPPRPVVLALRERAELCVDKRTAMQLAS